MPGCASVLVGLNGRSQKPPPRFGTRTITCCPAGSPSSCCFCGSWKLRAKGADRYHWCRHVAYKRDVLSALQDVFQLPQHDSLDPLAACSMQAFQRCSTAWNEAGDSLSHKSIVIMRKEGKGSSRQPPHAGALALLLCQRDIFPGRGAQEWRCRLLGGLSEQEGGQRRHNDGHPHGHPYRQGIVFIEG